MAGSDRDLFASLGPDERALLAWVAPQLDASAIEAIAAADYGIDELEYRRALTGCLADNPAVADPRLTVLGRALGGDTATPIDDLRALFTARR